jgi:flagellar hook assembly protein FlgD
MGSYPNPANPTTTLVYELAEPAAVTIQIFNMRGQMVRAYEMGVQNPGEHQQRWDGKDTAGHGVSSGVYFMRIIAGDQSANYRFLLMR